MALTTYAELQTAVANWLNRDDLASRIPEFIELADAAIRREQRAVRRIYSVNVGGGVGITFSQQGQALPANILLVRAVWPMSGSNLATLKQTSFDKFRDLVHSNRGAAGVPTHFAILPAENPTIAGPRIFFWPVPSGSYQFDVLYVHDVGKLGAIGNPLFDLHPDLYLMGALVESAPFLKHDERVPLWLNRYDRVLASINGTVEEQQQGASNTAARIPVLGV